jgi:hypothetical protein
MGLAGVIRLGPEVRGPSVKTFGTLRFCDLAALDAVSADADALGGAFDHGVYGLEIWTPATPGYVVRVGDVIAKLRAFAANVAYLCHCSTPIS